VSTAVVFDIETTGDLPWLGELVAVGIGGRVYRPDEGRKMARLLMRKAGVTIVAQTNYDLRWLLLDGATLGPGVQYHDTKVMAWLLDATQELGLEALALNYLGRAISKPIRKVQGRIMFESNTLGLVPIEDVPWLEMEQYNMSDLITERDLYEVLKQCLQAEGLWSMFLREEAPFSKLLLEMEAEGMPFDSEAATRLLQKNETRRETLGRELVEATRAIDFNPGSGDQVARFLYTELWSQPVKFSIPRLNGMTPEAKLEKVQGIAPTGVRVTKVGREYAYGTQWLDGLGLAVPKEKHPGLRPTVSGKVLDVLYGDHPWIARYIEWKKLDKLRSYLVDWIRREHDGKLHGRFDQSGTASGRLAGREPNLQQVAKESDVRGLFRGDLIVGDYAGLEARIAAHFSEDPVMLDVFRSGKDLYGVLAARAWGGPETKENENRPTMKIVWLASQYGARGETLAQTMAVNGVRGYDAGQADELLHDMMETVPRLFAWRDEVIAQAQIDGHVETLAGRKRHLADLKSANWMLQYSAERQAVSHKVQGSAADIVRRAMLAARKRIPLSVARICLQVHDEILWRPGAEWSDDRLPEIRALCEHGFGFELIVPLSFEPVVADSWAAKEPVFLPDDLTATAA
jgi:DNA polymerase I-like protein with 3'-5' exonuclease and polymerase domains